MDTETRQRLATVLAPLAVMYPNWHANQKTYEVYALVLADLDPDLLEQAVVFLLSEPREFAPMPGHIRQAAFQLIDLLDDHPDAYTSWSQVNEHFRDPSEPIHPFTREVADLIGGLRMIGLSQNTPAERARFIDAHRALDERRKREQRMLPATRNFIHGLPPPDEDPPQLGSPNDPD